MRKAYDILCPMRPDKSHFRVLVISPLSTVAGRMKLNGINRFLNEGHDWDIELVRSESEFTAATFEGVSDDEYDGIFVGWNETREIQAAHSRLRTPTVMFGDRHSLSPLKRIPLSIHFGDDVCAIVRAAAGHFNSIGRFVSYGFVPSRKKTFWSEDRGKAFKDEMARRGAEVSTFAGDDMAAWLKSLPKPAGILCSDDDRAAYVLSVCRAERMSVPDDVSVLGINNDAQICENTKPRLSSVAVDFEEPGYRAARELHAMMTRRRLPAEKSVLVGRATVVARASTLRESPSGALARRATEFIAANAANGIGPQDVVNHVRVSRRLLDLRFREATGKSLQEAIRERRLGAVKRLLSASDIPISLVAERCGYRDANYLKNQFKKAFGMSMRAYRRMVQS